MYVFDSLKHFFLDPKQVSIWDAVIISVTSIVIVSLLKTLWVLMITFVKKIITVHIPKLFKKIKQNRSYHQLLKKGEITDVMYEKLLTKMSEGQKLLRIEKKAMERACDEVKREGEFCRHQSLI